MEKISMWDAWVASIVDEDTLKPSNEFLYVKDGWIYGTNRHVLLMAKTAIKENGTYNCNTFVKVDTGYALWDLGSVMSSVEERIAVSLDSFVVRNSGHGSFYPGLVVLGEEGYQFNYIALAFMGSVRMLMPKEKEETKALRLDSLDRQRRALIMPYKM